MGFQQGLSGLSATSQSLDVIGNNIANANTVGMKSSRAEFSNIYASALGSSNAGVGTGVEVSTVSQLFTQGNISSTGSPLDVAINNNGFFQLLTSDGSNAFTRNGAFKQDVNGNLVTNNGSKVLGIAPDPTTGAILPGGKLVPLSVPSGSGVPASPTTTIAAAMNLDANATISNLLAGGDPTAVPPTLVPPLATYGTSVTAYDGQGVPVPVSLYFTKTALNTWQVWTNDLSGTIPAGAPQKLGDDMVFDPTSGNLTPGPTLDTSGNPIAGTGSKWLWPVSIPMSSVNGSVLTGTPRVTPPVLDLSKVSQYGAGFAVTSLSQDGQKAGKLTGVSINSSGILMGTYDNGKQIAAGQIQLATFADPQGLSPVSGGMWRATPASGTSVSGTPGSGNFGSLTSGALEDSNVDLTKELVDMMTAQRSYQANAQTIKTQDQVLSTLVNLR